MSYFHLLSNLQCNEWTNNGTTTLKSRMTSQPSRLRGISFVGNQHNILISQEAARYLAAQQVQTVGVDYLSVGGFFKDGVETHHALLQAGI